MTARRVLVTGGSGVIGSVLRRELPRQGWRVRSLDLVPPTDAHADADADLLVGDVLDRGLLDAAMADVDAVVHLAAIPDEAPFEVILASHVQGTYEVLDAARRAGVRRLVYASSNHAVGFTPRAPLVGVGVRPRPDTFYGVGKVAGEALCSLYADRYGLQVAALRIGSFLERPRTRRHLSTWLSPGDLVALTHACLTAPELHYAVVYGISANTRGWWDLEPGRVLGYEPQDDAEQYAAEILASTPEPAADDVEHAFLGGAFAGPAYDLGRRGERP